MCAVLTGWLFAAEAARAEAAPAPPAEGPAAEPAPMTLQLVQPRGSPCPPEPAAVEGDDWYAGWQKFKRDLEQRIGTSVNLCINYHEQVLVKGPGRDADRGVFWWDLHLAQRLWEGARLITHTRGGQGRGLREVLGEKLNTNWMSFEPASIYVSDIYLEQKALGERLTVAAGKFDVTDYFDANAFANWNFLSYSLARNLTIPYRYHALAAMVRCEPAPWFYAQASVADAQNSWTESGFQTAFDGEHYSVSIYEFGVRPQIGGRPGTYRLHFWQNTDPVARIDGSGTQREDFGFGLSFDQYLTEKGGVFLRYGHRDPRVRQMEHFWSVGTLWTGLIAERPRDVLAFGMSQALMGGPYRRAHAGAAAETLFELYYKWCLTPWCALRPNAQVILNPGADDRRGTAVVAGVSLEMSF